MGRRLELANIYGSLKNAEGGTGSSWALFGEAGIGKTSILRQASRIASRLGFDVRWGSSTWEGQAPLFPFLQLFPRNELSRGSATERGIITALRVKSARGRRTRAPARRPRVASDLLALRVLELIETHSKESPQLIVLDDFHRSDIESERFLRLLCNRIRQERVVVLLGCRTEQREAGPGVPESLGRVLSDLRIAGSVSFLSIDGLSERELQLLSERDLSLTSRYRGVGEGLVVPLVRISGGNPFLFRELLATSLEGRELSRPGQTAGPRDPRAGPSVRSMAPGGTVQHLLERRLKRLDPDEQVLLCIGALIGETFELSDVQKVVSAEPEATASILAGSARRRWPIVQDASVRSRYSFQHDLLREAALRLLERKPRQEAALRLARHWTSEHPGDLETQARLFAISSAPRRGLRCLDQLIDEAIIRHVHHVLPRYLEWKSRMLSASQEDRERFRRDYVAVLGRLRIYTSPELPSLCQEFLRLSPARSDRILVTAWYARSLCSVDITSAEALLEGLDRELGSRIEGEHLEARITMCIARGQIEIARGHFQKGFELERQAYLRLAGSSLGFERTLAAQSAAVSLYHAARFRESRRWGKMASREAHSAGLTRTPAGITLRTFDAGLEDLSGRFAACERLYFGIVGDLLEQGALYLAANTWLRIATNRINMCDLRGAVEATAPASVLAREWNLPGIEAGVHAVLGQVQLERGQMADAEREFRRSLRLADLTVDSANWSYFSYLGLARIFAARGQEAESNLQIQNLELRSPSHLLPWYDGPDRVRAEQAWRRGDRGETVRILRRCLQRSEKSGIPAPTIDLLVDLVAVRRLAGQYTEEARARQDLTRYLRRNPHFECSPEQLIKLAEERYGCRDTSAAAATGGRAGAKSSRKRSDQVRATTLIVEALYRAGAVSAAALDDPHVVKLATQSGISAKIGLPRSSFARALLRLVDRGVLEERQRRVAGAARREKAYFLVRWPVSRAIDSGNLPFVGRS